MEVAKNETPSWRSLRIMELPYETLVRAADILDVPALHNWRDMVALMPEYRLLLCISS